MKDFLTIDNLFTFFKVTTPLLALLELFLSYKGRNSHASKLVLFVFILLLVLFAILSTTQKERYFNLYKIQQDSIINSNELLISGQEQKIAMLDSGNIAGNIDLQHQKQLALDLFNENKTLKKRTINLLDENTYGTQYIVLDSSDHYSTINEVLTNNSYNSTVFLQKFSLNNSALSSKMSDFYLKPSMELYLDLFEISFFQWYESLHYSGWYVADEQNPSFDSSSVSPKNPEKSEISGQAITKELSKNKAIHYLIKDFEQCNVYLPAKTKLKINQNRNYLPGDYRDNYFNTEILIENKYFTITIELICNNLIELNNKFYIGQLGFDNFIKQEDKYKVLELSIMAKLKAKDNILFNENSAIQYYWANQLLEQIKDL